MADASLLAPGAGAQRLGSSLRCRPAHETWALAQPLLPRFGISRVSDITRMDRLGLPVWASVRPRGQLLRVHAGKGLQPMDAQVGALMEALEFAVAEPLRTPWVCARMPAGDVEAQFAGRLRVQDFAPLLGVDITAGRLVDTVACDDLLCTQPVQLPAELVFLPYTPVDGASVFGWSSNGLASGNSSDEATLHALFEVLERDALSMNRAADAARWVLPETLPEPFRSLVAHWRTLGLATSVRQVPSAVGLACFDACLHEPDSSSVNLAAGSGAHLDSGIALSRAICEAAQSRLSHVHGGRDDITHFYGKYKALDAATRSARDATLVARHFDRSRPVAFDEVPHQAVGGQPLAQVLEGLLRRVVAAGFGGISRHRFHIDLGGLAVVKVVVAGCEDVENTPGRMGPRLFAKVVGHG